MKKLSLSLIFVLVALSLFAQNYNDAIQQRDAALGRADYVTAIKKYLAAKELAPNKLETVLAKHTQAELKTANQKLASAGNSRTVPITGQCDNELAQAKAELETAKTQIAALKKQNQSDEMQQPKLEQEFIQLLPKLKSGFLGTNNPAKKVCKKLNIKKQKGTDYLGTLTKEFSKSNDTKK
jgi:hypothetical protein